MKRWEPGGAGVSLGEGRSLGAMRRIRRWLRRVGREDVVRVVTEMEEVFVDDSVGAESKVMVYQRVLHGYIV